MAGLNYGYEITIAQNATFDPTGTVANQWQRKVPNNTQWEDVGSGGETYTVSIGDRGAYIRLKQTCNRAVAYSNSKQVTSTDPSYPSASHFGSFSGYKKWNGGVLHPNGMVYAMPYDRRGILEIDAENKTTREISIPSGNTFRATGGVLGDTGKIHCLGDRVVYTFDPADDSWEEAVIPAYALYEQDHWLGGVKAPNGRIYIMPSSDKTIAEYDPVTNTAQTFGDLGTIPHKYFGAVLHSNGKIYGIPNYAKEVLEIDPGDGLGTENPPTYTQFATTPINGKHAGGFLAPNGKIYAFGHGGSSEVDPILEIDPLTHSTYEWESAHSGVIGCCLAPSGRGYGMPFDAKYYYYLTPESRYLGHGSISNSERNVNRFCGCVLTNKGKIVGIPYNNKYIEVLTFNLGDGPWPMQGLPGNILDPLSDYFNKY
jgi:hypothetical protein